MRRKVGSWDILFGKQLIDQRLRLCLNCRVLCVPCPPCTPSSCAIRPHIPRALEELRPLILEIGRKTNTAVAKSQREIDALTFAYCTAKSRHQNTYYRDPCWPPDFRSWIFGRHIRLRRQASQPVDLISRDRVDLLPRHPVTGLVRPSGLPVFQACLLIRFVCLSSLFGSSRLTCRYCQESDSSH